AGAPALLLPPFARARLGMQDVTGAQWAVVLEVLLGVQSGATTTASASTAAALPGHARRIASGAEPGRTDLRPQGVVGIEPRARLHERGRGDDPTGFGGARVLLVGVDRVRVTDRSGEEHDVPGLDREAFDGHRAIPTRRAELHQPPARGERTEPHDVGC